MSNDRRIKCKLWRIETMWFCGKLFMCTYPHGLISEAVVYQSRKVNWPNGTICVLFQYTLKYCVLFNVFLWNKSINEKRGDTQTSFQVVVTALREETRMRKAGREGFWCKVCSWDVKWIYGVFSFVKFRCVWGGCVCACMCVRLFLAHFCRVQVSFS